jgi:hypothetical protein
VSWSRVICTLVLHSEDLPGWVEKVQKEMASQDLEQKEGDVAAGGGLGEEGGGRGDGKQRRDEGEGNENLKGN